MSYINGNNIYGVRTINESPSRTYQYDKDERENDMAMSKECDCNNEIEVRTHHECEHDNLQDKPCEKTDNKWDCGKKDKCCRGDKCVFDPTKSKCICTYLDLVFSEDSANGSPIFYDLNTGDGTSYTIKAEYKSYDHHCCTPCVVDTTSEFDIENIKVTFKNFNYIGPVDVNSVLVNGTAVPAALSPNGLYADILASMFLDENCTDCYKGTKVSVLLNALFSWNFIAKIELCGNVTTGSSTCKFIISFINDKFDSSITVQTPSTFVAPEVCLPSSKESDTILLDVRFDAIAQLITPSLQAILSDPLDPTSPVILNLTGNLMINPIANLQIIKNTKVCFNAMI